MEAAGVPVVPGYHGEEQDEARLAAEAARIGFPGADQGLGRRRRQGHARRARRGRFRRARSPARGARRRRLRRRPRAARALPRTPAPYRGAGLRRQPRQRRASARARLLGPAPPPEGDRGSAGARSDAGARAAMHEAAVAAARAVGYVGAGTVEFIVARDGDLLLHGNEHAAAGRAPGDRDGDRPRSGRMAVARRRRRAAAAAPGWSRSHGHAIEVRLYAEDPARGFPARDRPAASFHLPEPAATLRIDTGVRQGDAVTPVLRRDDRQAGRLGRGPRRRACAAGAGAGGSAVSGVTSNLGLLARHRRPIPISRPAPSTPASSRGARRC